MSELSKDEVAALIEDVGLDGISVEDMYAVLRGGPTPENPIPGHERPRKARRTPGWTPEAEADPAGLRDAEDAP